MIVLFWFLTGVLSLMAMAILLPWLKDSFRILICIPVLSYVFYYYGGSSQYLNQYYSESEYKNRTAMQRIRPLMTELKKQEYRLRFHLEENPKDTWVQSQLLELLAIQALQAGDTALAEQLLVKAMAVLSKNPKFLTRNRHLKDLLRTINP